MGTVEADYPEMGLKNSGIRVTNGLIQIGCATKQDRREVSVNVMACGTQICQYSGRRFLVGFRDASASSSTSTFVFPRCSRGTDTTQNRESRVEGVWCLKIAKLADCLRSELIEWTKIFIWQ